MDESQLKEYYQEKENNERLRMIALSLYKEDRKELSPKKIYDKYMIEITRRELYTEEEVREIINHIRCLCISDHEYDADSPYEYSIENKYDPKFMDKFSVNDCNHTYRRFDADLTEELFRDEKRVIKKYDKLLYKIWKDNFSDGDIEEFLDYIYKGDLVKGLKG